MRKSYVALLLLLGAVAFTAGLAYAQEENGQIIGAKLQNARISQELLSRASKLGVSSTPSPNDTVYVGYNAAFAGSNYWSVGKGHPKLPYNQMGMWTWEYRVHGDSLQGWWPMRTTHTNASAAARTDVNRPWWAVEIGNQANYVINQQLANKRTFGVTGVWHSDVGSLDGTSGASLVAWTPNGGAGKSAWMGLRAHGDLAAGNDPLTGNTWNSDVLWLNGANGVSASGSVGSSRNFPGYGSQMDQMLYRDINVVGMPAESSLTIKFSSQTEMSTGKNDVAATRTGWFEGDPLKSPITDLTPGTSDQNFISAESDNGGGANSAAPVDSFEVFVGAPAETTIAGTDNFLSSTGSFRAIYDPLRRWFNEVLWRGRRAWKYSAAGTNAWATHSVTLSPAEKGAYTRNGKIRVVFRVHTNRGFDDEGTAYTSAGKGAAQLDDVLIGASADPANATTSIGTFETGSGDLDIDNSSATAWHSTGKPPAIYFHAHDIASLLAAGKYQDLCGPPGNEFRICNMDGIVISMGDHDFNEAAGGALGLQEEEGNWGMMSPVINLKAASKTPNNMGITGEEATATEDYYIYYEFYAGIFNIFVEGNAWQFGFQVYPALQRNGKTTWGEHRIPGFLYFNPDRQCFGQLDAARANALIVTSNGSGVPDSISLHLRKLQQCYRFGVTTGCSPVDGAHIDNVSLLIIDGQPQKLSADIWQWINDTFPVNENAGLPGTSAFDTTTAIIRTGLNTSQTTGNRSRYDVPGDSVAISASGAAVEIDAVFRVDPGPGNYVTAGSRGSGLRQVPTAVTAVTAGDGTWFGTYMSDPGTYASSGAVAQHAAAPSGWSSLVWNTARIDTSEANAFPVAARGFNAIVDPNLWMSTYYDTDSHIGPLGVSHPKCFLIDTLGVLSEPNIVCSGVAPAWVTTVPASRTGYDGNASTKEGTSIFPDGLFTSGTHVEYFFRRLDLAPMPTAGEVTLCPDTGVVTPQPLESSLDAHRWQEFSVLPDRWKDPAYTPSSPGKACLLYVDNNDRRGNEGVWVAVADSIGATSLADAGNHNGWARAQGLGSDINNPIYRTYKNRQAGTTWDMYGVKASESLTTSAGQIGSRIQYTDAAATNKVHNKYAKMGPTKAMLQAYYKLLMLQSGDLNSGVLGQFNDRSQNDIKFLNDWLLTATGVAPVGLWTGGDGFAESEDGHGDGTGALAPFNYVNALGEDFMGWYLIATNYRGYSANAKQVADLIYNAGPGQQGEGDIYGVRNQCTYTLDVLDLSTGLTETVSAADYENTGVNGPYPASAYKPATALRPWISLMDTWNMFNLRSRFGVGSYGRLAYYYNSFANWFGSICTITGLPIVTLDTPSTGNGDEFVNFMNLRNNPLRSGVATIRFGLAKADRVEIKVYDVTGRLVRTLADRAFTPGEHSVSWDGVNDHGQMMARGVYFTQVKYQNSRFVEAKKLTLLK